MTDIESCLPANLRSPATKITPITIGLSGAGVYRVEADSQAFVLKIWNESVPLERWRRTLNILRCAADAGLAPRIVHEDDEHRAVLSVAVADRSFPAFYGDPRTHAAAVAQLGRTIRDIQALPVPPDAPLKNAHDLLAANWSELATRAELPPFAADTVRRALDEVAPASDRAPVLSHNDLNPGNILYDGERLLLVDWDHAGPNDPFFDLATIAVFLDMDDAGCMRLLDAYDADAFASLPARFEYNRRLVGAMAGSTFLKMALQVGFVPSAAETRESTLSLRDVYQRMRAGAVNLGTAEGQWVFGLALMKESAGR